MCVGGMGGAWLRRRQIVQNVGLGPTRRSHRALFSASWTTPNVLFLCRASHTMYPILMEVLKRTDPVHKIGLGR